ncbi:helix-turn-helix transcriptional regulator [Staphylococcus saprophyticus]|uniref:helix-turn-helix domain-containing protein n=2 Tax=Staphylococcus saprophyticus TaxID=29385 RepID=UPI001888DBFD|nr:helix-turn-helix transcriptional regulator [Staphylococcus saprophyticus]MBF2782743.1 helix-turn-helix transcriptional regulator [Staphylococcus saprophyticus]
MNKSLVSKIRKKQELTQESLAEKSFVTVRTIQRVEAGEEVSNETLRSISNALGVTVSELYESVDSVEKEIELMEYSKKQNRQFNQRKHEFNGSVAKLNLEYNFNKKESSV